MADVDEKEKAEKLAAARKRFEQLKKQKGKGGKAGSNKRKEDQAKSKEAEGSTEDNGDVEDRAEETQAAQEEKDADAAKGVAELVEEKPLESQAATTDKPPHKQQPSLSLQSKIRSASFRRASLSQGPLSPVPNGAKSPELSAVSPDGESLNSIYRKQAARLDELERENKRLAQEAQDAGRKLKNTEEELDELREGSVEVAELKSKAQRLDAQTEELGKIKQENTSLQRQLSQLQSQMTKRHASSPSQANASTSLAGLQSQLDSKSSTIESMEMEISNLHYQLDNSSKLTSSHSEQVTALEEKLGRAERAAGDAQRELADTRKNLQRANEKALREGTGKASADTNIRNLGRVAEENKKANEESLKRIDTLEKKLHAITNMNKDADSRRHAGERERERLEKEAIKLHRRLASLENENLQLREERNKNRMRHVLGTDDEGLDELEDAERRRLEIRIRDLESEVFELRRGVWRDRRRSIQPGMDGNEMGSPGENFDDVDLDAPSPYRKQSIGIGKGSSSFSNVLSSGLSAFTGTGSRGEEVEEFDEDTFDESAFRQAQEEEAMKRIERVKEIKRGLKDWEGWRMDIVDLRRIGGGGLGEIFDV